MINLQIRLSDKRSVSCECDFESWLIRQNSEDEKMIIEEWYSLPTKDSARFFPMPEKGKEWNLIPKIAHVIDPPTIVSETSNFQRLTLSSGVMKALSEYIKYLESVPYQIIIQNNYNYDVENLTVFYYVNQLIGNQIIKTGPFSKSLSALPSGQTVGFETCPCLNMATDYNIAFYTLGQQYYLNFNIEKLNIEEKKLFNTVDLCADTLEIGLFDR